MKKILLLALLAAVPAVAIADTPSREREQSRSHDQDLSREEPRAAMREMSKQQREAIQTINDSTNVYRDIVLKSPKGEVPMQVREKAKCVAVFPKTVTAAVVVGGMHGKGVVSCKLDEGWSAPALASISGASLGAQIGGKSADLVLFINSDDAVSSLKQGKLDIGADAGYTVGSYDANISGLSSGVVGYQRTEGGYLGASLGSTTISLDEDAARELYGKDSDPIRILDGVQKPTVDAAKNFSAQLPT